MTETIPNLLSVEELRGFTSVQLVSRFAGARQEACYGKALLFSGRGGCSTEKICAWEKIERQLEEELLRRLDEKQK